MRSCTARRAESISSEDPCVSTEPDVQADAKATIARIAAATNGEGVGLIQSSGVRTTRPGNATHRKARAELRGSRVPAILTAWQGPPGALTSQRGRPAMSTIARGCVDATSRGPEPQDGRRAPPGDSESGAGEFAQLQRSASWRC